MKRLCIVAHARTGTNYLCNLLDSFRGVRCYKELFHPNAVFGLDDHEIELARKKTWRRYRDIYSSSLVKYARGKPERFLRFLDGAQKNGIEVLCFKIFPSHLPWELIESDILSHDNTHFLFVKRNMLESFISFQKAKKVKKFSFIDTTEVKVSLRASEFLSFAAENAAWFDRWEHAIEDRGFLSNTIMYGSEITTSEEESIAALGGKLKALGLPFGEAQARSLTFEKQDKGQSNRNKVENWEEFVSDLSLAGVQPIEAF